MEEPFDEIIESKDIEAKEGYHCRFCWTDEQSEDNPLISACKCTGTMGLVHLDCLRAWQSTKMQTKRNENLISLYWKTFECEICKTAYPFKVKHKDKVFRLVEVDVDPSQCRLVLESLIFDKNSSRMIHVILPSTGKRTYKMVRVSSLLREEAMTRMCESVISLFQDSMPLFATRASTSFFKTMSLSLALSCW